jgi:hypothetical protein
MSDWILFGVDVFVALACLVFLLTYATRAQGLRSPVGRTLIAIKFGIFGVATLLAVSLVVNIDGALVRWIFCLLMVQIGISVIWQTWTIFRVNERVKHRHVSRNDH